LNWNILNFDSQVVKALKSIDGITPKLSNLKIMNEFFNWICVRKNAIHSIWKPSHLTLFQAKAWPPTGKELLAHEYENDRIKTAKKRFDNLKKFKLTFDDIAPFALDKANEICKE